MEEVRETNNDQRKKPESSEAQEQNTSYCKKILQLLGRQLCCLPHGEGKSLLRFYIGGKFFAHNELINNKFEK